VPGDELRDLEEYESALAESRSASDRFARRSCSSRAAISASGLFISDGGGGRCSCLIKSSVDWLIGLRSPSDAVGSKAAGSLGSEA
jgi:hypothetical protein